MARPGLPVGDDAAPDRPRRPLFMPLLAAIAIAPLLYEGMLICVAGWAPIFDRKLVARTPAIDAVAGLLRSGLASLESSFDRVPWRPEAVMIVGLLCFVGCALLLRRK